VNGACADSQVSTPLHPIVIGRSEAEHDGNGMEREPLIPTLIRRSGAEPDQRGADRLGLSASEMPVGVQHMVQVSRYAAD